MRISYPGKGATCHMIAMVWLYGSPISLGRKGGTQPARLSAILGSFMTFTAMEYGGGGGVEGPSYARVNKLNSWTKFQQKS
jgi:hypothetical protein